MVHTDFLNKVLGSATAFSHQRRCIPKAATKHDQHQQNTFADITPRARERFKHLAIVIVEVCLDGEWAHITGGKVCLRVPFTLWMFFTTNKSSPAATLANMSTSKLNFTAIHKCKTYRTSIRLNTARSTDPRSSLLAYDLQRGLTGAQAAEGVASSKPGKAFGKQAPCQWESWTQWKTTT